MPKLKFRFRVTFLNFGVTQPTTELTKQVVNFKRPSEFGEIQSYLQQSQAYLAGKPNLAVCTCSIT
jgi:hypothetical protein